VTLATVLWAMPEALGRGEDLVELVERASAVSRRVRLNDFERRRLKRLLERWTDRLTPPRINR
jgi:hypothetical protein